MTRYADDHDGHLDMRADETELRHDNARDAHYGDDPTPDEPILCAGHRLLVDVFYGALDLDDAARRHLAEGIARTCDDCEPVG